MRIIYALKNKEAPVAFRLAFLGAFPHTSSVSAERLRLGGAFIQALLILRLRKMRLCAEKIKERKCKTFFIKKKATLRLAGGDRKPAKARFCSLAGYFMGGG